MMLAKRLFILLLIACLAHPLSAQNEEKKPKKEAKAKKPSAKDLKKQRMETYMAPFQPFVVPSLESEDPLMGVVLYHTMFIGFDTSKCILTHAWMPDAPPPKMKGFMYLEPGRKPLRWNWYENGAAVEGIRANYLETQLTGDSLVLVYVLTHPVSQARAVVHETLFCMRGKMPDRPGLAREFTLVEAPAGVTLGLTLEVRSLMAGSDLKYSGKWLQSQKVKRIFDWGNLYDFFGEMEVSAPKPTVLRMYFPLDPENISKSSGSSSSR